MYYWQHLAQIYDFLRRSTSDVLVKKDHLHIPANRPSLDWSCGMGQMLSQAIFTQFLGTPWTIAPTLLMSKAWRLRWLFLRWEAEFSASKTSNSLCPLSHVQRFRCLLMDPRGGAWTPSSFFSYDCLLSEPMHSLPECSVFSATGEFYQEN